MNLAAEVIKRLEVLETDREIWDTLFEGIRTYIYPTTASFSASNPGDRALDRNAKIFDPTAERAHSDLVGAIMSGMTNQAMRWFEMSVVDQKLLRVKAIKRHLEDATDQILALLSDTAVRFYPAIHEAYYEITGLGTGVLFKRGRGLKSRFETVPLADIFFEENDEGLVDVVYRPIWMTPKQLFDQFPEMSDEVRRQVEHRLSGYPSTRIKVVHTVRPNQGNGKKAHKFESVYALCEGQYVLEVNGYKRFPFYIGRWEKIAGREAMGRSPAMKALKDAKVLNNMVRTNLEAGEKVVQPPLQAPFQSFTRKLNLTSKAVNYYKSTPGLPPAVATPLVTVGNLPIGLEMENQRRRAIQESFYIDLIAEGKQGRMTSLEVAQREQERLGRMAPQMSRIQTEILGPLLLALYEELVDDGIIGEPPAELSASQVAPIYNSPLARAQRQANSIGLQRFLNSISVVGQIAPEVLKTIHPLRLVEEMREIESVPLKVMRTEDEFNEEINTERQAEKQRAAVEQTQQLSEAGRNIADIQSKGVDINAIFA
jgi:hypothetical protein